MRASAPMPPPATRPAKRRRAIRSAEGNVGAGAGASVGKLFGIGRAMKGGIGTASIEVGGITVAALVAVNAIGDVVDPRTGRVVAGARTADGRKLVGTMRALQARRAAGAARAEQRRRRGDDDRASSPPTRC